MNSAGGLVNTVAPVVNAYWAGSHVVVLRREQCGRLLRQAVPAEHVCYLRQDVPAGLVRELRGSRRVVAVREAPGGWWRVGWGDRDACLRFCLQYLPDRYPQVQGCEGDVHPVARYLAEHGPAIAVPRRLYLDLEADSRVPFSHKERARILAWAVTDEVGETRSGVLEEDSDAAEAELLVELWRQLELADQVLAWNGDGYDFPLLFARTKARGLRVEPKRWLWLDHLDLYRRMHVMAAESGDEKASYALGAVAQSLLGESKLGDGQQSWPWWQQDPAGLEVYNRRDAELLWRVEAATGYVGLLQAICEVCGVLPDSRAINPTVQLDGYLLRRGYRSGVHFRTVDRRQAVYRDTYGGAYVMEPRRRGLLRDVHVVDFRRLYPSVILSWNMSPETHRPEVLVQESREGRPAYLSHLPLKRYPLPPGHCVAPTTDQVFALEPQGALAAAVQELLVLRDGWDAQKAQAPPKSVEWVEADRRSTACKIAVNSFYGVVGTPVSRYYVRAVAESVSLAARWLEEQTVAAAEKWGLEVVYADTDSSWFPGATRQQVEEFVAWANAELYPALLREHGCRRNEICLTYEKAFAAVVMVTAKRYAARFSHYKGRAADPEAKPEVKGLEYMRGDSVRLARRLQAEVIGVLLRPREPEPVELERLVERYRQHLLEQPLELEDVVLAKGLGKPLKDYVRKVRKDGSQAALPAHVEVALELQRQGADVTQGTKIAYVVADATTRPMRCVPASAWGGQCDRCYLWEELVYPPSRRVLEAVWPAQDWARWAVVRPPKARAVRATATGTRAARRQAGQAPQLGLFSGHHGSGAQGTE